MHVVDSNKHIPLKTCCRRLSLLSLVSYSSPLSQFVAISSYVSLLKSLTSTLARVWRTASNLPRLRLGILVSYRLTYIVLDDLALFPIMTSSLASIAPGNVGIAGVAASNTTNLASQPEPVVLTRPSTCRSSNRSLDTPSASPPPASNISESLVTPVTTNSVDEPKVAAPSGTIESEQVHQPPPESSERNSTHLATNDPQGHDPPQVEEQTKEYHKCEACGIAHNRTFGSGRFCTVQCARRVAASCKWAKQRKSRKRTAPETSTPAICTPAKSAPAKRAPAVTAPATSAPAIMAPPPSTTLTETANVPPDSRSDPSAKKMRPMKSELASRPMLSDQMFSGQTSCAQMSTLQTRPTQVPSLQTIPLHASYPQTAPLPMAAQMTSALMASNQMALADMSLVSTDRHSHDPHLHFSRQQVLYLPQVQSHPPLSTRTNGQASSRSILHLPSVPRLNPPLSMSVHYAGPTTQAVAMSAPTLTHAAPVIQVPQATHSFSITHALPNQHPVFTAHTVAAVPDLNYTHPSIYLTYQAPFIQRSYPFVAPQHPASPIVHHAYSHPQIHRPQPHPQAYPSMVATPPPRSSTPILPASVPAEPTMFHSAAGPSSMTNSVPVVNPDPPHHAHHQDTHGNSDAQSQSQVRHQIPAQSDSSSQRSAIEGLLALRRK